MASALVFLVVLIGAVSLALLAFSFAPLSATEMALQYNYVFKTINPNSLLVPGLHFVGPCTSLIRYPKTILTLEYTNEVNGFLDSRTKDGLPIVLGVTFQYRLIPNKIADLYRSFENAPGDYKKIFKLAGIHLITELATNYTAYAFFNDKQKIAEDMTVFLNTYFTTHLFASIASLQINHDDLPAAFNETVVTAETSKQNITTLQKVKEAKKVEFQTAIKIAQAQANVTIQKATGEYARILQNGYADATIIKQYTDAETMAYGEVKASMGLSGDDLINYMWYNTLEGAGVSKRSDNNDVNMLVGVTPQSNYIVGATPRSPKRDEM